jgi:MoxR-like ATPase
VSDELRVYGKKAQHRNDNTQSDRADTRNVEKAEMPQTMQDDDLLDDVLAELEGEGEQQQKQKDAKPKQDAKPSKPKAQPEPEPEDAEGEGEGEQEQPKPSKPESDDLFHRAVVKVMDAEEVVRGADVEARLEEFAEQIGKLRGPSSVTIVMPDGERVQVEVDERLHKHFADVAKRIAIGMDVMIVGPAGSGKTTLAEQVARALSLKFGTISCTMGMPESHLIGRSLPGGENGEFSYRSTPFVDIAEGGGLFLADEFDASDANVVLVFNQYLANGRLPLPMREGNPIAYRHKDARFIAALNTFGRGADRQYVGRNQLDEATLDRFACNIIEIDYDRELESSLVPDAITDAFWPLRDAVTAHRLRRIVSTRAMVKAHALVTAGVPLKEVMQNFLAGWTSDERSRVGY